MPRIAAWPLALSALAHGGWLAWREARAVRGELVIAGEGGRASVDGRVVEDLLVRWRGPIAFVEWRDGDGRRRRHVFRSEEHTSELQSLMRISYAVFCLKKKNNISTN